MTDNPTIAVIKFLLEGIRARETEAVDWRARRRQLQLEFVNLREAKEIANELQRLETWITQAEAIIAELQQPRPRRELDLPAFPP